MTQRHVESDQRPIRKPIELIVGAAIFDRDVTALDEA